MQHQPAKQEKHDHARPEDPLVLPRPPLDHADGIARHAQRVGDRVQPLLGALEHLPLRAQVAEHGLPARDVVVQRRVGVREEVLLAQRVVLARHIAAAHVAPAAAATPAPARGAGMSPTTAAAAAATVARGVRVGVLRGGCDVGPAAEQLGAVLGVVGLVAGGLQGLEVAAVLGQLGAEVADALVGFLLLRRVELLLGERGVLVDGLLEGGEGRGEGAQRRGGEGVGGGGGAGGGRGVGGDCEGLRAECREVFADGGALFESAVEGCVLVGVRAGVGVRVRGWSQEWRACLP